MAIPVNEKTVIQETKLEVIDFGVKLIKTKPESFEMTVVWGHVTRDKETGELLFPPVQEKVLTHTAADISAKLPNSKLPAILGTYAGLSELIYALREAALTPPVEDEESGEPAE